MKNFHIIAYGSVIEALRLDFSSRKRVFLPKIAEMHSLRVMNLLKHPPSLFIGKKGSACRPEASWGRFLSAPQLLSSPPFRTLRKSYGSLTKVFRIWFSSFFLFPFTNVKWNMFTQGFWKFYGGITEAIEAPKTIFQLRRGVCRPVASSLSNPTSKIFQKGLDSNFYLHPYLDKFTPHFCVFGRFLSEISRNFTDSTAMNVKPS